MWLTPDQGHVSGECCYNIQVPAFPFSYSGLKNLNAKKMGTQAHEGRNCPVFQHRQSVPQGLNKDNGTQGVPLKTLKKTCGDCRHWYVDGSKCKPGGGELQDDPACKNFKQRPKPSPELMTALDTLLKKPKQRTKVKVSSNLTRIY